MATTEPPLWSLPKQRRPRGRLPFSRILLGIAFGCCFNAGILLASLTQIVFYPLLLVPLTAPLYARVLVFTKQSFGQLCVFITQWFAPTEFVVSAGEGMGEGQEWLRRDGKGRVAGLRLPVKGIWMSNHQTLSDWLYIWSFSYFSSHHSSILITLKASLRRIPFVGWACSLWGFIFLERNWLQDQTTFKSQLERAAKETSGEDGKLALLIFPEGTTVTGNTRPVSKKFAEKLGVPDFEHTILPRSTGIFFALRTLSRTTPTLKLVDLTIGYPGPQAPFWPEDYYDLLTWFNGISPPQIHVHLRQFSLSQIPLGTGTKEEDATDEEKKAFDQWLRERWGEKDALLKRFSETGSMVPDGETKVVFPIKLRSLHEHLGAFCYFLPVGVLALVAVPVLRLAAVAMGGARPRGMAETSYGCGAKGRGTTSPAFREL